MNFILIYICAVMLLLIVLYFFLLAFGLYLRGGLHWVPDYFYRSIKIKIIKRNLRSNELHLMFCFVDHFEPYVPGAKKIGGYSNVADKVNTMENWSLLYPKLASKHFDSDGVVPQHTWFFPAELYNYDILDKISQWSKKGYGELEVHLHHENDTPENFYSFMMQTIKNFSNHGAMIDKDGKFSGYGFIHGNWALDNSHPQGLSCGINNEITLLSKTGCYADFTYPSLPSPTQPLKVNSLYYAKDDPLRAKSHDSGIDISVGGIEEGDLLIIQGPVGLNWNCRTKGIFPKLENSDITSNNPPLPKRIDFWVKQHIHVYGRPEWVFVKVHTHGAVNRDKGVLLGEEADAMYSYLEKKYNNAPWHLHYVTAREFYNIIKAAEVGNSGDPNYYRDFLIPKYLNSGNKVHKGI